MLRLVTPHLISLWKLSYQKLTGRSLENFVIRCLPQSITQQGPSTTYREDLDRLYIIVTQMKERGMLNHFTMIFNRALDNLDEEIRTLK